MAAVWIIIAKTRHPAKLIESSKKEGVKIASIPFDISAEFIPDLLRGPDERLEKLAEGLPPEAPEFSNIIHRCQAMSRVITKARVIAPRSVSTIIEGESGTGKELLARAIHNASPRKNKPFVALNCGAIPTELIESELFGHEKGAFTGADSKKIGYFEAANGGTFFLDEIGELPLAAQVKLLRAIQEKAIVRVGSTKPVEIDVRIIAATNRNLIDEIAKGKFRSDLFYRIAVAVLKLPPLRERKGDIGLLIDGLLNKINKESVDEPGYEHKKLSSSARNILINHSWAGNVRELQNTLRRAAIWSADTTIGVDDVREAILPVGLDKQDDLLGRPMGDGFNITQLMEILAKHYLERALNESASNKTKAAKLIGLPNYQTLTNWMIKYKVN
jgi:transcriptional regulator with PAS, ATPase and Fis domain